MSDTIAATPTYAESVYLRDRVVLLFGASGGGMGTSTAFALASAGASVVGVDISLAGIKETERMVEAVGGTFLPIGGDVRKPEDLEGAYAAALERFERIDAVVHLVGGTKGLARSPGEPVGPSWGGVEEYDLDVFPRIMELNMTYAFRSCQLAARHMIERGRGAIVNFSSISAYASSPFNAPYGMAKAGIISMTKSLAVELGVHGIRVNCILPGATEAPAQAEAHPTAYAEIVERTLARSPLGRRVHPDDIAKAVLFLVSDLSSGVTGQCIAVDVGATSNHPLGTRAEFFGSKELRRKEQAS